MRFSRVTTGQCPVKQACIKRAPTSLSARANEFHVNRQNNADHDNKDDNQQHNAPIIVLWDRKVEGSVECVRPQLLLRLSSRSRMSSNQLSRVRDCAISRSSQSDRAEASAS